MSHPESHPLRKPDRSRALGPLANRENRGGATLQQVADELSVTRERARQIETRALRRLQTVALYLRDQLAELGTVDQVAQAEDLPPEVVAAFVTLDLELINTAGEQSGL
ncbi:MAG: sigma factor-like helix-turn-helix DNA-binding protein [Gemmatimonadota bacterium]